MGITGDTGYTLEVNIKVDTLDTVAVPGAFATTGIYASPDTVGNTVLIALAPNSIRWTVGATGGTTLSTDPLDDKYHVITLVKQPGADNFWIWKDYELLNPGGLPLHSNGYWAGNWDFGVGRWSGSQGGIWEMDYMRLTPGAFAPIVPEPGSLVLMGLGGLLGLAVARRRRRGR